jgi:hypothetical protein
MVGSCLGVSAVLYLLSWPLVLLYVFHTPNGETVQLRSFNVRVAGLHPTLHGLKIAPSPTSISTTITRP